MDEIKTLGNHLNDRCGPDLASSARTPDITLLGFLDRSVAVSIWSQGLECGDGAILSM